MFKNTYISLDIFRLLTFIVQSAELIKPVKLHFILAVSLQRHLCRLLIGFLPSWFNLNDRLKDSVAEFFIPVNFAAIVYIETYIVYVEKWKICIYVHSWITVKQCTG